MEKRYSQIMLIRDIMKNKKLWSQLEDYVYEGWLEANKETAFLCTFDNIEWDGDLNLDLDKRPFDINSSEGFKKLNVVEGIIIIDLENDSILEVDGNEYTNPFITAGLSSSDTIVSMNGISCKEWNDLDIDEFHNVIDETMTAETKVIYVHEGIMKETIVKPIIDKENKMHYKLNVVRNYTYIKEEVAVGWVVYGDVTITDKGSLINRQWDGGPTVYINGNVEAENMIAGGGTILIEGDVTLQNTLVGLYNDGTTVIDGEVKAKIVINMDHHLEVCESEETDRVANDDYADYTLKEYILPEILDAGWDTVIDAILEGKEYRNKHAKTRAQIFLKEIEKMVHESTTTLDLSKKQLKEIPEIVYSQKELMELKLKYNMLETIPSKITDLKCLKELDISGNPISSLPDTFEHWESLEILHYNGEADVYEQIAKLPNLKELHIENVFSRTGFQFPMKIFKMKTVTHLHISNILYPDEETIMENKSVLPEEIGNMKQLKKLDISYNYFTDLGTGIEKLENLEELHLTGDLYFIEKLPDLSKLPKLKKLYIGASTIAGPFIPEVPYTILEQLFSMKLPELVELYMDCWSIKGHPLPDRFDNMPKLKLLSIMATEFDLPLPSSFKRLEHLEKVKVNWQPYVDAFKECCSNVTKE